MAMGKVNIIGEIAPQKPLITKISTHYNIHHDNDLTPQARRYQEMVRYPVLAVTRPSKSVRQNLVGITLEETPVRKVKSCKSERLRTSHSKSSETARSLPDTLSQPRSKGRLKQSSPTVVFRSTPKRGHTMPLIVNKPSNISGFERDFWTYWKSVKTGEIHPDDACTDVDRRSMHVVQRDSSTDLDNSDVSSRFNFNSPSSSLDPDKLSIKNIFKFLNMTDMNVVKKNKNSLERVRLLQKSVRKRGNTLTTVEMALNNARRHRHPEKPEAGMPAVPKTQDDLGPIVNSPLLKETLQKHMSQPAMPVEKAVKHHSFTYVSKQRSRRIRDVFVAKKTSPHGTSNVPQSRTLAVFSRQVPEMTDDSLEAALSHRTATVHDTGRGTGYSVEGKKYKSRSQHDVTDDQGSSKVVRLPKVPLDPDNPDDIINGVALVNFSKITEKMNSLDISGDEEGVRSEETDPVVESSEVPSSNSNVVKGPKKQVNIHLPTTESS
ncbi:uncharacterized protein LOC135488081 [Lineus longissimus]|uniref:uncharacterized protein LOC135488081 n=1 Tax=Lineus longissimus TaxID=88925 RepID=UPI00315D3316